MIRRRRCKCCHCGQLYQADPRNCHHHRYCSQPDCRKASKLHTQQRWRASPKGKYVAREHRFDHPASDRFGPADSRQQETGRWRRLQSPLRETQVGGTSEPKAAKTLDLIRTVSPAPPRASSRRKVGRPPRSALLRHTPEIVPSLPGLPVQVAFLSRLYTQAISTIPVDGPRTAQSEAVRPGRPFRPSLAALGSKGNTPDV